MNYIGRCDPVPLDSDAGECVGSDFWFRFPVCEHPEGMQAFFDICVPDENEAFSLSETEAYRLCCHVLVQHLPAAAFREAIESLNEMHKFYRHPPALPAQAVYEPIRVKIAGSYAAPVFPITED